MQFENKEYLPKSTRIRNTLDLNVITRRPSQTDVPNPDWAYTKKGLQISYKNNKWFLDIINMTIPIINLEKNR